MPETIDTRDDTASRLFALFLGFNLKRHFMRLQTGETAHGDTCRPPHRGGQFRLLGILLARGNQTTQGLADALHVSAPTVSAMLRRLEEQGFVTRERDPDDQRVVRVAITEDGLRRISAERQAWRNLFSQRLERLSPEDQTLIREAIPAFERLLAIDPAACPGKES